MYMLVLFPVLHWSTQVPSFAHALETEYDMYLADCRLFHYQCHHITLIYHIDPNNRCCNHLISNSTVKAHWWLLVRCPSSSPQETCLSTLKKDTGQNFLKQITSNHHDNVLTTEGWQPLPTPGVQGWLALVFGGQTVWERLVLHPAIKCFNFKFKVGAMRTAGGSTGVPLVGSTVGQVVVTRQGTSLVVRCVAKYQSQCRVDEGCVFVGGVTGNLYTNSLHNHRQCRCMTLVTTMVATVPVYVQWYR